MFVIYCEGHVDGDFLDASNEWHYLDPDADPDNGILNYSVNPFRKRIDAEIRKTELERELENAGEESDGIEIKELFLVNYYQIRNWD